VISRIFLFFSYQKKITFSRYSKNKKKENYILDEKSYNVLLPGCVCPYSRDFCNIVKKNDNIIGEKFVILEILKTIFFSAPISMLSQYSIYGLKNSTLVPPILF
jgi:hypothetical protein